MKRAEELGAISLGKQASSHTLRHSYARHLLMNGIPINYLSRWLGAQLDSDNPHLPRACSRPDGEPGDGAVTETHQAELRLMSVVFPATSLLFVQLSPARAQVAFSRVPYPAKPVPFGR